MLVAELIFRRKAFDIKVQATDNILQYKINFPEVFQFLINDCF